MQDRISVLIVGGMNSPACITRIDHALRAVPGVESVGVNLLTRMTTVRHQMQVKPDALAKIVSALGYHATLASPGTDPRHSQSLGDTMDALASRKSRFVAGALLTFFILIIDRGMSGDGKLLWLFLLATPVQITVGWDYYRGFFKALRRWSFNMDSLVVLGSTAAYMQGTLAFLGSVSNDEELMRWPPLFAAAALILTVVSLGKWLESHACESSTKLWGSLMEMMPLEARVYRDGREQVIPAGVVAIGDEVLVRPGEKIPVDGVIVEGECEVNETLITGEGRPVQKVKGDKVLVASMCLAGPVKVRTTGAGDQTSLAQISRLVADANTRKAPVQQLADRVSGFFVPVVFLLAVATFMGWYFGPFLAQQIAPEWITALKPDSFWFALTKEPSVPAALLPAIAVLVVACPCALGLATPMVVLIATGLGARRGLLIKGGQAIEAAGRISDVVFEKTGILTDGSFRTQDILTADGVDREELLHLAASLEAGSEHALAKGVINEARKCALILRKVEDLKLLPGRGLYGRIGGRGYLLGSRALLQAHGMVLDGPLAQKIEAAEADGLTTVFLAEERGRLLGALAMSDRLKDAAPAALADLRNLHLNVHLLTGDNPAAAAAVGRRCGLKATEAHALMSMEDKIDFAWQLRDNGRRVAMVGDGINDAPAMAAADVGIALGAGTDIYVEAGSIVLVSPDPRGVGRVIHLCREALSLVRWNLLWAFLFNVIMIPLAALNFFTQPWALPAAAGAMMLSSVLVVVNSLRLTDSKVDAAGALPMPAPHPSAIPAVALVASTPINLRAVKDE